MRPVPKPKHRLAALIFAAVAAVTVYFAFSEQRLSQTQVNIICAALKDNQQDLFKGDPVFGQSNLWQFHTPVFQGFLKLALVPSSYEDVALPFRILCGVILLIFLTGMYVLIYRQTHSWGASCFVAVLSATVTSMLGGAHWGLGPLQTITPPTIFLAMVPLIVLAYLHYQEHWRLVLVFLFIGLMGNVHLVSAMNLTIVLLLVYLAQRKMSLQTVKTALSCGAVALLAAAPYFLYYFGVRHQLSAGHAPAGAELVASAFRITEQDVLYPRLLWALLDWDVLLRLLGLGLVAAVLFSRVERFKLYQRSFWAWFIAAVLAVSLLLQAASQVIGVLAGSGPPAIDFLRASNLLLLPLYVLLAQGVTNLFRLVRTHRRLLQWACAAMMAAWMLPSPNLAQARLKVFEAADWVLSEPDKPKVLRDLDEDRQRRDELDAIARWAKNTDNSIYLTDQIEFRLLSRRPITASADDVRYIYYLTPWRLEDWVAQYARQQRILSGDADPQTIKAFFVPLAKQELPSGIERCFLILEASNHKYADLETVQPPGKPGERNPLWGRFYRIYRVDLTRAEATWGQATAPSVQGSI